MGIAFPVQGFGRQKIRRLIMIGGDWDEFSAQYVDDTTSVTLSANGTAKRYSQYIPYPAQSNNPLTNYLVLIIQVSGYITLASGATSGSATVSVVMNGTTLTSATIMNTNNQLIINQIIPYSQFPSGYQKNNGNTNTVKIQVTLGTGTASVTITQVQYMFCILLQGGSSGLTVQIPISQPITFINDDPSLIQPYHNGNPFGLGVMVGIYDPFGLTTGIAQINLENGTVILNANGNEVYSGRAFPVSVSNGNAYATLTISVSANNSVIIGYYNIAIIVSGFTIQKGYAHQLIFFRANQLQYNPTILFLTRYGALPETAIWQTNFTISSGSALLNQVGSFMNLYFANFNWKVWQSYQTQNYLAQVGNAKLYQLTGTTPKFILEFHHIAEGYGEGYPQIGFGNNIGGVGLGIGYMTGRITYVEVEE